MRLSACRFVYILIILYFNTSLYYSQTLTAINHIIHMGQSLGAGEHSLPIVTDSATGYGNLSFKMGTHTWQRGYMEGTPELRDPKKFSFITLTAWERGHEGETIGNGLCDHLKKTSKKYSKTDFKFLFSFSGQGGRLIRELDKIHDDAKDPRAKERQSGGGIYKTAIDDVKRAKAIANSKKLSYSVFAITWMQGESNTTGFINRWTDRVGNDSMMKTYIKDLMRLRRDIQSDVTKITKQKNRIPFFTYQTFGTTIGTAQLMACDMDTGMYMVGPTYMMPNGENSRIWHTEEHGDGIHLTADGERWLGEMFGKVMRKVVFEKQKWQPLRPLKSWASKDKKHIFIQFHVPSPPLVLDTNFLPKQGQGCGFEVYDSKRVYQISSIKIIPNDNVLDIELKDTVKTESKIFARYAEQSYVAEVSKPILSVSEKDTLIRGVANVRIEFAGDILDEFNIISSEGVFTMANKSSNKEESTDVLIRKVYLDNGNTILLAEKADWNNNVAFKAGQNCYILRRFAYGNLRDSDPEESIFYFKDKAYGNRFGQQYPLYNWSVAFKNLKVD